MENRVRRHVNNLFKSFEQDEQTLDTKEELISNLLDRINDSIENGTNENDAFNKAIGNLGTKNELRKIFNFKNISDLSMEYTLGPIYLSIVTVIYFILGFVFSLWHPGWVIYVVALAFSNIDIKDKKSFLIPALSMVYVFIGFMWDFWHPGWIVFPIGFVLYASLKNKTGALWLMTTAIYVLLGALFGNWIIFSVIFLIAAALVAGKDEFIAGLWLFTIASYLVLGFAFGYWHPGWLVFGVTLALTTLLAEKSIVGFTWVAALTTYLGIGLVYGMWHPTWIMFIAAAAVSAYVDEGEVIKVTSTIKKESIVTEEEII